MGRPRILLVPTFTELAWEIKPLLEEWAEVASFDPPGVGDEPLPPEVELDRSAIVQRGLAELDRRGWERFFMVADGWGIPAALGTAGPRSDDLQGLALGHAMLRFSRSGPRPTHSPAVYEAMTQLLRSDYEAFIRHGIVQVTGGSFDEERAQRMVERFPEELIKPAWEAITSDVEFETALRELRCPLLFAMHEGCLMSTPEGFEDAADAFPEARTMRVPEAPSASPAFAVAVRELCAEA